VTVTLSATDASAVTQVCLSSALPCTAWLPYSATKPYALPAGDGNKVVYALFKDTWNNVSVATVQAGIRLDTTLPTEPRPSAVATSRTNTVSWVASTDSGSGVAGYKVVMLVGTALPAASCTTGSVLADGVALNFVHAGLVAGTSYAYRVCARDGAGNVSAGATVVVKAVP
jgi:hypothetical protein